MPSFPSKHSSCLKEELGQVFLPKSTDITITLEQKYIRQLLLTNSLQTNILRAIIQVHMIYTDQLFFTDTILIEKVYRHVEQYSVHCGLKQNAT